MAITVGTDTYISVADANTYLTEHHLSTELTDWADVYDSNQADCEVLLRKAAQIIDRQPISGIKAVSTQTMQFPRVIHADFPYYTDRVAWDANLYTQPSVPTDVGYAQAEIAMALASGSSDRATLQKQGVKSYSIGNLSETFSGAGQLSRIPSSEAIELLRPYITGTVRIV